jgi:hypothetical protein
MKGSLFNRMYARLASAHPDCAVVKRRTSSQASKYIRGVRAADGVCVPPSLTSERPVSASAAVVGGEASSCTPGPQAAAARQAGGVSTGRLVALGKRCRPPRWGPVQAYLASAGNGTPAALAAATSALNAALATRDATAWAQLRRKLSTLATHAARYSRSTPSTSAACDSSDSGAADASDGDSDDDGDDEDDDDDDDEEHGQHAGRGVSSDGDDDSSSTDSDDEDESSSGNDGAENDGAQLHRAVSGGRRAGGPSGRMSSGESGSRGLKSAAALETAAAGQGRARSW